MIASWVSARTMVWALTAGSILTLAWRICLALPDPETPARIAVVPPPATTFDLVPLMGEPLDQVVDALDGDVAPDGTIKPPPPGTKGTCLPFLAPIVERPRWELQIGRGWGCMGGPYEHWTVDFEGHIEWRTEGLPTRQLQLQPEELQRLRTLDRLDCVRTTPVDHYWEQYFRIGVGDLGGAAIPASSTMGKELTHVIYELIKADTERLAAFGPIEVELNVTLDADETHRAPRYRLAIVDRRLTVTRHHEVLVDREVTDAELRDLLDSALSPDSQAPKDAERGTLRARGISIPFVYGVSAATEFLSRAIYDAADRYGEPRP